MRLFLLGARRGLPIPKYPCPTTGEGENFFEPLKPKAAPTCKEALADLPDVDEFPELMTGDSVQIRRWKQESDYAADLRCETPTTWHHGYRRKWDPTVLTSSMRTAHSEISRRRFAETPQGQVEPISRFFRLSEEGQSNTLRAGTDSARGAFTSPRPIHYAYARCITVREMARLHGYPDWYRFHITKWHGARQIGNSVPPPLARAVATSILHSLGIKPNKPRALLDLGKPDLLALDMREAAEYWGIDVPIARRDRKSGAHKRKQREIEEDHSFSRR
jgi:DNA (cytosine-5)-methyltransferase 1